MDRTHKSAYWMRRRAAALNVLADPLAGDRERHQARLRLNRAVGVLGRLNDIPPMKRRLAVDNLEAWRYGQQI